MEYCVLGKDNITGKSAEQVITLMLHEYSRQLYGFTRAEFDSIVEYDVLIIMASYYTKINAQQKKVIISALQEEFSLCDLESVLENLAMYIDDKLYMPLSCKLIDKLGDSRATTVIYETLFKCCSNMLNGYWNQSNSYSNYLVLLNVGFFNAIAYKLHLRDSYSVSMENLYDQTGYDEFVESLYEKHLDDIGWDADVELDVIDELINDSKITSTFDNGTQEEYMHAVESMKNICREHVVTIHKENEAEGFTRIVQKTGIRELKSMDIQGFECHFCEAKFSDEKYIIVYQKKTHINEIIDKEDEWSKFQKELYYDDIRQDNSKAMVYIVYILDDNSDNIPIQIIESNKTYGRKYVFSEDETITFINGIVKTSNEEIGASPVQEWDRILREEHLTACLTESYAAKKVENYLSGQRFDADYVQDDDYSIMNHSEVTQIKWVKSLDTTGFRDFCFDKKNMTFGQINLFYGANGSGKTSVLEAIEYALTSEVRRVKDFKVKMPTDSYPELHVYDTEAGVRTFTPGFSKKNNKEIERVWYGVPIGRTKSNLNENFNRFNAFDSEAAYKFIHESDNSEDKVSSAYLMVEPWKLLEALGKKMNSLNPNINKLAIKIMEEGPDLSTDTDIANVPKGQPAVEHKLETDDIVTVWGPPGTGKTYTMAKIANSYIAQGKSVLIVSHSNVSVDGVIKQVVKMLGTDKQSVLEDGKILRFGYVRDDELSQNPYATSFNYALSKCDSYAQKESLNEKEESFVNK